MIAAWGGGDGMGANDGMKPGWAEDGATDWSGGFLLRLKDGRYAYVWGWCDYTGWGCQDGAYVRYYDSEPRLVSLAFHSVAEHDSKPFDWDESPADLNRWLAHGAKDPLEV